MPITFRPGEGVPQALRRQPKRSTLAPHEVRPLAIQWLREGRLSVQAERVLEALAVAGVLTNVQLRQLAGLSYSSEVRYFQQHLLDRLPPGVVAGKVAGLTYQRVYTLGALGLEIAQLRHGLVPKGYLGQGRSRVAHDLRCNQVLLSLYLAASSGGRQPIWRSKYEATVHQGEKQPVLEPDALLTWRAKGGEHGLAVLEYHHEDSGRRVAQKLDLYERVYRTGLWQQAWEAEVFPVVLVVWTHGVVGEHYRSQLRERPLGGRMRYLGKPWQSVMEDDAPEWWLDLRTNEVVNLFEG